MFSKNMVVNKFQTISRVYNNIHIPIKNEFNLIKIDNIYGLLGVCLIIVYQIVSELFKYNV